MSKYVDNFSCLMSLKLLHSATLNMARDCQTPSGRSPRDEPWQVIDGCGGKDFAIEKRRISTTSPIKVMIKQSTVCR